MTNTINRAREYVANLNPGDRVRFMGFDTTVRSGTVVMACTTHVVVRIRAFNMPVVVDHVNVVLPAKK